MGVEPMNLGCSVYRPKNIWWTLPALPRSPPACKAGALLNELRALDGCLTTPKQTRTMRVELILPHFGEACYRYTISEYFGHEENRTPPATLQVSLATLVHARPLNFGSGAGIRTPISRLTVDRPTS